MTEAGSDGVTTKDLEEAHPPWRKKGIPSISSSVLQDSVQTGDDESVFQFATFPHVLRHVLTFLDIASLKNCRGVSQLWNEEASPLLGQKTVVILPNLKPNLTQIDMMALQLIGKAENLQDKLAKYEGIKESLCLSPNLFRNFKVFCPSFNEHVFKDFIQNCGNNFKSLKMISKYRDGIPVHMEQIQEILTQFCPNLVTLEVDLPSDRIVSNLDNFLFPKPLMITTLKFDGYFTPKLSAFYMKLIQSCPQLTSLDFQCATPGPRVPVTIEFPRFLQILSEFPKVTENLREFSWRNKNMEGLSNTSPFPMITMRFTMEVLEAVSRIKFSSKLKKLTIGSSADEAQVENRFLPKLLNNVGHFVEHLTFTGTYRLKDEVPTVGSECWNVWTKQRIDISDYPEMPSVKFLSNQSKFNYGGLMGPTFVGKVFPNLVKYVVERTTHCKDEEWIAWYPKSGDFFLETLKKEEDICTNESLKSLAIFREVILKDSLNKCIQFYPNLTEFVIVAGYELIECPKSGPLSKKLPYIFSQIVNLKCLKHFTCLYPYAESCYSAQQLCQGLKNVKKCEQLESLTIVNTKAGTEMSFEGIKKGLDELQGLKCILRLSRFHMPESEVAEMMRYAKDKGIRLAWVDGEEEGPGRAYQLPRDSTYSNHEGSIVRIGWDDQFS